MNLRRISTALLMAALSVGAFGSPAEAQDQFSGVHMVTDRVMFRSQRNNAALGLTSQEIANGYVDSTSFTRQGKGVIAGGATGTADTTAPISLQGMLPNPADALAAMDSIVFFRFSLVPGADCAAAATIDSVYVIPQVSVDGNLWECANLVKDAQTGCVPFTAADILTQTIPVLRRSNAGVASVIFHSCISGRVSADLCNIGTWPMVRFIVLNDISASATAAKHQFSAHITRWSNRSQ
ncbi:MAG TPA: hypothetical protein VK754_06460 [Propionibacteriaceae bacterium]|nr:hypothetical protein [Propionibacteriaceae bacterium]